MAPAVDQKKEKNKNEILKKKKNKTFKKFLPRVTKWKMKRCLRFENYGTGWYRILMVNAQRKIGKKRSTHKHLSSTVDQNVWKSQEIITHKEMPKENNKRKRRKTNTTVSKKDFYHPIIPFNIFLWSNPRDVRKKTRNTSL